MDRALSQCGCPLCCQRLTGHSGVMVDQIQRQGGVVFNGGIGLYERQRCWLLLRPKVEAKLNGVSFY